MRLAPQILPVMRVHASFLVMVVAPRAPNCFEIKHIKIRIFWLNLVKQINCNFVLRVSECAHFAILAILHVVWIRLAELALVFLRVVEFFDAVVCLQAGFAASVDALVVILAVRDFRTHLARIRAQSTSSVLFGIVVEEAPLWIMWRHASTL